MEKGGGLGRLKGSIGGAGGRYVGRQDGSEPRGEGWEPAAQWWVGKRRAKVGRASDPPHEPGHTKTGERYDFEAKDNGLSGR